MMTKATWMAVALALAAPVGAQEASEQAAHALAAQAPPPTATVRYGPDDLRLGELRMPAGKGPFPVAVLIHGGCWSADVDNYHGIAGVADALVKRGIAVWNIEYRRLGNAGGGWPGTFQDVAAGVDYLPTLARRYALDLKRVTIVGHSSGAHLALWAASRPRLGAPWDKVKVHPLSVVAIDGPGTLAPFVGVDQQACGKPVIVPLMGGTPAAKPKEYALASPAEHLPLGLHQLLVLASFTPFMAPYAAAAQAAGDRVETLQAGDDHFHVITPGTADGDKVIDLIATRAFAR